MTIATLNPIKPTTKKVDASTPLYPVPAGASATGITMYDWLAAVAMQGLMMHGMKIQADRAMTEEEKDDEMAERSYRMAAAMLRTRVEALKQIQ